MSVISYNGVTLPYAFTTRFSQDPVYDESNTDWYCTKYDIQVQSIINSSFKNLLDTTGQADDNPADIMATIRARLLRPRRKLSMTFNGIELIPQAQSGLPGQVDAQNGPHPQTCTIMQCTNTTFLIVYHIIAHYWENRAADGSNSAGNPVLYNRWSETVEIDNCLYSQRTREGKYVIRSDNVDGVRADRLRANMAAISVPAGWLRTSSQYTVTPNGLGIQYRVIDKEVFKLPPKEAYEADGEYTESGVGKGCPLRYGEVRVRLRGSRYSDPVKLVNAAITIAASKLHINGGIMVLEHASIQTKLYDNAVEVRLRAMMNSRTVRTGGATGGKTRLASVAGLNGPNMTFTPLSDSIGGKGGAPQPEQFLRGTSSWALEAAAYYDPNLQNTSFNGTQLNVGFLVGQAGKYPEPG